MPRFEATTLLALLLAACGSSTPSSESHVETAGREVTLEPPAQTDLDILRAHLPELVELRRGDTLVAVAPEYQGRVMTSVSASGRSHGWINRELIASGERTPHMNAFGGEDRFWLGPEGGPYALYFPPGAPFEFEHWQVPAPIDTDAWAVAERSETEVTFRHSMALINRAGTQLSIDVERTVRLVDLADFAGDGRVTGVAYESINAITNAGDSPWTRESGLVSIWILSMYQPSPRTTVVVPFRRDAQGTIVNADYFGRVPPERLRVDEQAGVIYFLADGRERGKIGVPLSRARPLMGSWDADHGVLTLVEYTLPSEPQPYVDSTWRDQEEPYAGDVVNSYNDGPPEPGVDPLGPFYELESSSPAAALAPGERLEHTHRTFHLEGPRGELDAIARERLGVGLDAIESTFR